MSGIFLPPDAVSALHDSMQVLLAPNEFPTLDAWRAAALRGVARALGADLGVFVLRDADGSTSIVSDGLPRTDEYVPRTEGFDARLRLWNRQLALTTWSRAQLWGRHLGEMRRSSYFHDFIKPIRGFDTIGLTVRRNAGGGLASLHLNHDTERGTPFGDRGLALLRLIEPAFRTGLALSLTLDAQAPLAMSGEPRPVDLESLFPMLTPREREVVCLVAARRTNREIATMLAVAPGTIKRHVENALRKVGVSSRRALEPLLD